MINTLKKFINVACRLEEKANESIRNLKNEQPHAKGMQNRFIIITLVIIIIITVIILFSGVLALNRNSEKCSMQELH